MDSKGLQELTDIYLKEISADTALAASKKADVERGKAAAGGDREKAKAKAAQASRLYKASAEKRKKEPVATPDRSYPKGKGASYREEVAALRGLVEKKKESYKTVAAVIDYDRSKKGTDDATYDSEHGEKKKAKKERDYAAWEREKMKKDDPNWKHKKGSTSESVEIESLVASGVFSEEEIAKIVEADRLGKLEESEKVAQGAQKRAEVLASRRRQKGYREKGYNAYRPGKNERAGYNLSRAARSSDASPETQRTKKKKPAGEDTSQIGHYKKRDEKVTVGKRGKPLKQPKYKLSMGQRVDHHSNKAWSRRDPKQNPKHTANK